MKMLIPTKQIFNLDTQSVGNLFYRIQRCRFFAPFYGSHVCSMNIAPIGKFVLRNARILAQLYDSLPELNVDFAFHNVTKLSFSIFRKNYL